MKTNARKSIKTRTILLAGGTMAVLAVGTLAVAGPLAGGSFGPRGQKFFKNALSADQREQVHEVLAKHQPTIEPLVRSMIAEHREVRDAIQEGPKNARAIQAQVDETAAVAADLAVAHAYVVQDLKPIFTPEQRARFLAIESRVEEVVDNLVASDWSDWKNTLAELPGPGHLRERLADRRDKAIEKLGLTEQQIATIQTEIANRQGDVQPLIEEIIANHRTLKSLYRAESVDEAAIRATVAEMAETAKQLAVKKAQVYSTVTYSFTDDQKEKLAAFKQRRENRVDAVVDFVFKWIAS